MSFDISRLTSIQLEQYLHMQAIVDRQEDAAEKVILFRDYYDGVHPVLLTKRQKEFLSGLVDEDQVNFSHNLVRSVIDTLRERLAVTGIAVENEAANEGDDAQVSMAMWDWWQASRMDAQQIRHYRRALRDGYSYVMVSPGADGTPVLSIHKRDAGTSDPGVMLHRDPEDENQVLFASRYFYTFDPLKPGSTGIERKTVYLPGEIRKYIRDVSSLATAGWKAYMDDGDTSWPIPWVDSRGQPLGVAVIEFENPGGSEIDQILGLQNGLNKSWLDLIAAADTSGFPLIAFEYAPDNTAFDSSQDDADSEGADEVRLSPGRLLEIHGGTAKRIESANLQPMIDVIWTFVQAISGVSRTPAYYLKPVGGGDVPSGEALKQLESGLVRRAEERQLIFGQAWRDVFALAYRVNQTFGKTLPDVPEMDIDVTWQDANVRNEPAEVTTAEGHKRLGVPDEILWRRLGYTPEQIQGFKDLQMSNRTADIAAVTAALRVTGTPAQNGNGQVVTEVTA